MPEPLLPHQPASPETQLFAVGMDRAEIFKATRDMDPGERVQFWSTFEPTTEIVCPSIVSGKAADDIAAVLAGSKPATLLSADDIYHPMTQSLIAEEKGRYDALFKSVAFDHYGNRHFFWGTENNVKTLANLYQGRGKAGSPIPADEAFHRAVGEALGYPPEAIDDYLEKVAAQKEFDQRKGRLGKFLGKLVTKR